MRATLLALCLWASTVRADAPFDLLIQLKGRADVASVVANMFVGTDLEYYLRGKADGLWDAYYIVQYARRLETN